MAKSGTHVLEAANSALRLFGVDGTILATKDLNTFFGADCSDGVLFDPRVYFDRNATNRRFYVVAAQASGDTILDPLYPGTPGVSGTFPIWLGVSRGPEPTNLEPDNWCRYALDGNYLATLPTGGQYTGPDYPALGVGEDFIAISTNQWACSISPLPSSCPWKDAKVFTFAIIKVVDKLVAANNPSVCPSIRAFTFQPAKGFHDFDIFTLQPVQHYTSPSAGGLYLMNTQSGSSNIYKVWRVQRAKRSLTIQGPVNVTGSSYGTPPHAPQALSNVVLDTGDTQITQAAGIGYEISGVHSTVCNVGGGPNQSCIRYVRISVGTDALTGGLTASLRQENTLSGGAGVFDFKPGVARNALG